MENIFISHSHQDRQLAEIIANYLTKVALRQFKIWYSSDESSYGGVKAGKVWFEEILSQLSKTKVVIVLLTPNSIDKPWVYFESGFGQSINCEIIPTLIGISKFSQVPPPLSFYQSFQISDYAALKKFTEKLLANYNIPFEEEVAKGFIEATITKIVETIELQSNKLDTTTTSLSLEELKNFFENKFNDLKATLTLSKQGKIDKTPEEISVLIHFPRRIPTKQFLELSGDETVGDVITRIYFMIKNKVQPYSYLEEWVLRDISSKKLLAVKEIQDYIPARLFFNPNFSWEVIKLEKPYNVKERNSLEHLSTRA